MWTARLGSYVTHFITLALETVGWAPKGTSAVHKMLMCSPDLLPICSRSTPDMLPIYSRFAARPAATASLPPAPDLLPTYSRSTPDRLRLRLCRPLPIHSRHTPDLLPIDCDRVAAARSRSTPDPLPTYSRSAATASLPPAPSADADPLPTWPRAPRSNAAIDLEDAGRLGVFTPMFLCVMQKPARK